MLSRGEAVLRLDPALCEVLSCCAVHEEACIPLQQRCKGGTRGHLQRPRPWEPPPQVELNVEWTHIAEMPWWSCLERINQALTTETKSSQSVWHLASALGSPPSTRELVARSACPNRRWGHRVRYLCPSCFYATGKWLLDLPDGMLKQD